MAIAAREGGSQGVSPWKAKSSLMKARAYDDTPANDQGEKVHVATTAQCFHVPTSVAAGIYKKRNARFLLLSFPTGLRALTTGTDCPVILHQYADSTEGPPPSPHSPHSPAVSQGGG